jgi:LPS-assembly lipoprotein
MTRCRALAVAVTLAATVLVAGCGFHLQGRTVLPALMRRPYIEASDQQSDFVQSLRRDLIVSGAHPTEDRTRATAVIHVRQSIKRRVLSVSATDRPTEYRVTYTVQFSVEAAGKTVLKRLTVTTKRSYTFNESLVLADEHERSILTGAMGRELADIVMRRLAAL